MTVCNAAFHEYITVSDVTFHEYYGTLERFTNESYASKTVYMIYGNSVGMAEFLSMEDGVTHTANYTAIKNLISYIRLDWQQSDEPIEAFKDELLAQWIPLPVRFMERWGKELVPYDVCSAIHDVCRNVGINAFAWPPILLVNADGSVAEPDEVDHLGRVKSIML